MTLPAHKTKIVATIGPASQSQEVMVKLIEAGMNVARLNFSHGDFTSHGQVIKDLRAAAKLVGRRIAIMADLSGPKMRIGKVAGEPVELHPGDLFTLTTQDIVGDARRVSVSFERLPQAVKPGDTLYLNDGYIELIVLEIEGTEVRCKVWVGGELRSRKGLNLPDIELGVGAFTPRDRECLAFALEAGVDAVSQSFVEGAADIEAVRSAADELGYRPFIIAKIERSRALEHVDEILAAADGIMIARGDLGVEVPIEQIALIQKRLMRLARVHGKPVITATQMLESMTENRRPTRAEATDVANAILDGTDCVMLSGESAAGKYPVEAVAMLARIAAEVEPHRPTLTVDDLFRCRDAQQNLDPAHLIAASVEAALSYVVPASVFVPTRSGDTARRIASCHFPVWVVAVSSREATCQQIQFSSGIFPVFEPIHPSDWRAYVRDWMVANGAGQGLVYMTEGPSSSNPYANHRMEIIEFGQGAE
jgi:pyruvate kinase